MAMQPSSHCLELLPPSERFGWPSNHRFRINHSARRICRERHRADPAANWADVIHHSSTSKSVTALPKPPMRSSLLHSHHQTRVLGMFENRLLVKWLDGVEMHHARVMPFARSGSAAARQLAVITPVAIRTTGFDVRPSRITIAFPMVKPSSRRLTTGSPPLARRM